MERIMYSYQHSTLNCGKWGKWERDYDAEWKTLKRAQDVLSHFRETYSDSMRFRIIKVIEKIEVVE
jgi:hypothetical protein